MSYNYSMTENKWGGKRAGAGRPKQEKVKKQYTFRLSEEELQAVREVLAKMRGKLILLFALLTFCLPCFAIQIDDIKQEAFKGVYKYCPFPNAETINRSTYKKELKQELVKTIQVQENGFTDVIYKDLPSFVYRYKYKKDTAFTNGGYYCNSVVVNYGNKTAVYHALSGKLMAIKYAYSPSEEYYFDMNGNLIAQKQGETLQKYKVDVKAIRDAMYFVQ